jgi:hypothetical protein
MTFHGSYHDRPVRPYVVTRGRVRPSRNTIRPETLLIVRDAGQTLPASASSEERALLRMCRRLLSLVEAAVHLQLPVSVVSIVASDLVDAGFLAMRVSAGDHAAGPPGRPGDGPDRPDRQLLEEILNGLRRRLGEAGSEGAQWPL